MNSYKPELDDGMDTEFSRLLNLHGESYHFNRNKVESYGETVRIIGHILCDFSIDIHIASQKAKAEIWGSRKENPDLIYGYELNDETPDLMRAVETLCFEQVLAARVQIQKPGSVVTNHFDDFAALYKTEEKAVRIIIPLQDWESGQALTFGNTVLSHWKAGDVIYSDYENTPHSTCNASWDTRSLLVATGVPSPKTVEMLAFNLGTVILNPASSDQ